MSLFKRYSIRNGVGRNGETNFGHNLNLINMMDRIRSIMWEKYQHATYSRPTSQENADAMAKADREAAVMLRQRNSSNART
jgi:hypothetical protein